jgi:hypothetical protein
MSHMSDSSQGQSPQRGEAAWRAAKEGIAARNAQARKAGKQQRHAAEEQAARVRAARDRAEMAALVEEQRGR